MHIYIIHNFIVLLYMKIYFRIDINYFLFLIVRLMLQGKVPLLSITALHHLHIFIFVLAVVHVTFCALTILFGGAKVTLLLLILWVFLNLWSWEIFISMHVVHVDHLCIFRYENGNNGRILLQKENIISLRVKI